MNRNTTGPRLRRAISAAIVLAALTTACSSTSADHHAASARPTSGSTAPSSPPGRAEIHTGAVDLSITHATVHLGASGGGTLTMTVRNGGAAPEHLDMVATPGGGRGAIHGGTGNGSGSLTSAGVLIRPGSTITFGGSGPGIRFTAVHGITPSRTLPLALEFGIAGLVHLDAVVK